MPILVALYNLLPIIDRKIPILTSILHAHIKFIEFLGAKIGMKYVFTFMDNDFIYNRKS
jgi:hypothetical protein